MPAFFYVTGNLQSIFCRMQKAVLFTSHHILKLQKGTQKKIYSAMTTSYEYKLTQWENMLSAF